MILFLTSAFMALPGCSNCTAPEESVTVTQANPEVVDFRPFVAVISVNPDSKNPELLKALLSRLANELSNVGMLPQDGADASGIPPGSWLMNVECRAGQNVENGIATISEQRPYVFITSNDVNWLTALFTQGPLKARMDEIAQTLDALPPGDSLERRRLQQDPLNIARRAKEALENLYDRRSSAFYVPGDDRDFIAPDQSLGLVLARTAISPDAPAQYRALLAACERAKARALTWLRTRAGGAVGRYSIAFVPPNSADSAELRQRVTAAFGRSLDEIRVEFTAKDDSQAIAAVRWIRANIQPLVQRGNLAPLETLLDVLPPESEQRRNFETLRGFDFVAALKAFQTAVRQRFGNAGLVFFKPFLQRFEKFNRMTREPQPLSLTEALNGPLRTNLAPFLRIDSDGSVHVTLIYYPKSPESRSAIAAELKRVLQQNPPVEGVRP